MVSCYPYMLRIRTQLPNERRNQLRSLAQTPLLLSARLLIRGFDTSGDRGTTSGTDLAERSGCGETIPLGESGAIPRGTGAGAGAPLGESGAIPLGTGTGVSRRWICSTGVSRFRSGSRLTKSAIGSRLTNSSALAIGSRRTKSLDSRLNIPTQLFVASLRAATTGIGEEFGEGTIGTVLDPMTPDPVPNDPAPDNGVIPVNGPSRGLVNGPVKPVDVDAAAERDAEGDKEPEKRPPEGETIPGPDPTAPVGTAALADPDASTPVALERPLEIGAALDATPLEIGAALETTPLATGAALETAALVGSTIVVVIVTVIVTVSPVPKPRTGVAVMVWTMFGDVGVPEPEGDSEAEPEPIPGIPPIPAPGMNEPEEPTGPVSGTEEPEGIAEAEGCVFEGLGFDAAGFLAGVDGASYIVGMS